MNQGDLLDHQHSSNCRITRATYGSIHHENFPRSKYTYAIQGQKKIRLLGVGKERDQITVTLFIVETGEVLDCQMIFGWKNNKMPSG